MKRWIKTVGAVAGGIVGSTAAAVACGSLLWNRATARGVGLLVAGSSANRAELLSLYQLEGFPSPVVRYFELALTPGQPLIRGARVEQTGEIRIGGSDSEWSPFTARQHFGTDPPGFVWDATIRTAPFLTVRVRDTYLNGGGSTRVKLASLITVADQSGHPKLDTGALHRYLAEAVWVPTALLPVHGIVWEAINATTARATLTDAASTISLEFQFDENGAIVGAYTPQRYREVAGAFVPTPWRCSYGNYTRVDRMRVPMEGAVEWVLPEGRWPCWRGRIRRIEYEWGH